MTAMTAHFVVRMWCRAKSVVRMWCREGQIRPLERRADRARSVFVRRLLRQELEVEAQFLGRSPPARLPPTTGALGGRASAQGDASLVDPGSQRLVAGGVDAELCLVEAVDAAEGLGEALAAEAGVLLFGKVKEAFPAHALGQTEDVGKSRASPRPNRARTLSAANSSSWSTGPRSVTTAGRIRASHARST